MIKSQKKANTVPASRRTVYHNSLLIQNPNACGIDVGSAEHLVCVPIHSTENNVLSFGTFTCDLEVIADWLEQCGVTTVAMESTGVYWIPLYQILEKRGLEVFLVNTREVKSVSGRPKTDAEDCQWIQRLHSYGLLKTSFRPTDEFCRLRSFLRQRERLLGTAKESIQHMQKALREMNLLLDNVVTDITGVTGMKIIRAIISGNHDNRKLAEFRDKRIRASKEEIRKSLQGDYRFEHLFALKQALLQYDFSMEQIRDCDRETEKWIQKMHWQTTAEEVPEFNIPYRVNGNSPENDWRGFLFQLCGTDLTAVNGLNALSVITLISETGTDMSCWKTEKQFTSWLGLAPNNRISGGKILSSHTRKVRSRAAGSFRMAAMTLARSRCYLGAFYRRIKSRHGPAVAITATARKLAVIYYKMLKKRSEFKELGSDFYEQKYKDRAIKGLKRRAEQLGFSVTELPMQA